MLWGEPTHGLGPLSAEQLQRFDADGFVVIEDVIGPATITACLAELADSEAEPRRTTTTARR